MLKTDMFYINLGQFPQRDRGLGELVSAMLCSQVWMLLQQKDILGMISERF